MVISGTELARQIQREIQRDVEELVAQGNMRPHLGVVLVGDDPASRTYVKNKTRAASILGKTRTSPRACVCVFTRWLSVTAPPPRVQVSPATRWCGRARCPRRSCWS